MSLRLFHEPRDITPLRGVVARALGQQQDAQQDRTLRTAEASGRLNAKLPCATDEIAEVPRHADGIAAGLSQCRRKDLDDPEGQRHRRNLAQRFADKALSLE